MNFKNIHIGQLIEKRVAESGTEMSRICNFFNCTDGEILEMYEVPSIDTEILLKWSKILDYDFFRLYTQHLILYAPLSAVDEKTKVKKKIFFTSVPKKYIHQRNYQFRFGTN